MGVPDPKGERRYGGLNTQPKMSLAYLSFTRGSIDQRASNIILEVVLSALLYSLYCSHYHTYHIDRWLGGVTAKMLDLRSKGHGCDSCLGVAIKWLL